MSDSLENYTFVPVLDKFTDEFYGMLAFRGLAATDEEIREIASKYPMDCNGDYESWSTSQLLTDLQKRGYDVVLVNTDYRYKV